MVQALAALAGALALAASPPRPAPAAPPPAAEPQHLFDIATAGGEAASTWAALAYDRAHDELFAIHGGVVHVYNSAAMESFSFGGGGEDDDAVGSVERLALLDGGEMLLLTRLRGRRAILRVDFRGERLGPFEPAPLPAGFEGFDPDRLQVSGGRVWLVETGTMRLVVTGPRGQVEQAVDLAALVRRQDPAIKLGMSGFWAEEDGTVAFTMPMAFTAFVLTPARELRRFGTRGSSPGKFNVVGAVAADEQGTLFLLDRLRSVVLMFGRDLRFLGEFGYRGDGPTNLVAPYDLAVGNGKVFVSQARERGVKVFRYQAAGGQGG